MGRVRSWSLVALAVGVLALAPLVVAEAKGGRRYQVTGLDGPPGSYESAALAVNDLAQVVGWYTLASGGSAHAVLWDTGTGVVRDLGDLGGDFSSACAVNDLGQAVGTARLEPYADHACLWDPVQGIRDLLTLGGQHSNAGGINNLGQVVGISFTAEDQTHLAFLWDAVNGMQSLGHMGGHNLSCAADINEQGEVCGWGRIADGNLHAFFWDPDVRVMQDLGTLGVNPSYAQALNDSGVVVGLSSAPGGGGHAVLWKRGRIKDLGTLGGLNSWALGVNNKNQVVGYSQAAMGSTQRYAVVWEQGTRMQKLDDLLTSDSAGWSLEEAHGINDKGQIVGWGTNASGQKRAFLATPVAAKGRHEAAMLRLAGAVALATRAGAEIVFTLGADADVTVTILNVAGRTVAQAATHLSRGAGRNSVLWDACTDDGARVPSGRYLVQISAHAPDGATARAVTSVVIGQQR
jgi:probable HAF family extracellular repeat protein